MYISQPDGSQRRLWNFHGGLRLSEHKELSSTKPVSKLPIPERLILPLQQHIGTPSQPLVQAGERVYAGQTLANPQGDVSATLHAPTSGTILAVTEHAILHPSGLTAPCIILKPDGCHTWSPNLPPPITDFHTHDPNVILARIKWAGVVGLGGAAFPSNVKLQTNTHTKIHTLILNGVECEPYITCDDALMRTYPNRILQGAQILLHILGANHCLIGIEDNKPQAIAALYNVIQQYQLSQIQIVKIPTIYPSGGEKQLIKILTGLEVPSQGLPSMLGIMCHNVGTAAAIADAVVLGLPLISRITTVTGRGVNNPHNVELLIGTPITTAITHAGGYTDSAHRLIVGGPMMGFTAPDDSAPITKGTNCLLVTSPQETPNPPPASPCIRCGQCAQVCPANLLPQQLYWYCRSQNLQQVQAHNLFDCIECGCCSYVCPASIPLVQYYRATKSILREQTVAKRKAEQARLRHTARQSRMQRLEQERQQRLQQRKLPQTLPNATNGQVDPKQAAIAAAMHRVAAKKQQHAIQPRNTDNLSPNQQQQIQAAQIRRHQLNAESTHEDVTP